MKDVKVRVEIRFIDLKHNSICNAVLASDGFYDFDRYMYEAINSLGLRPDPCDKFEVVSFKVYNCKYCPAAELPALDKNLYKR